MSSRNAFESTRPADWSLCVNAPRFFSGRPMVGGQVELEEAVRKGNEKFNTMITEQLMAQEDIRRAAEVEAEVTIQCVRSAQPLSF